MYAYYEKNEQYKENFRYFIENVVKKRHDIDYYLIINGECTVKIPNELPNVVVINRENKGFDFGAYSHCVSKYITKFYDYYIFLNTSVHGPHPPDSKWLENFIKLFNTGKDVKLVGTSINMYYQLNNDNKEEFVPHVQSMFFILDHESFCYLRDDEKFFANEEYLNNVTDKFVIINEKEIGMSQKILQNGWNINSILPHYRDKDYRVLNKNINTSCMDPYYKHCYFGKDITREDAIFYKIEREHMLSPDGNTMSVYNETH